MSEAVGAIILNARERLDLSQRALGDECGMHYTSIGFLERGNREPSLRSLVLLGSVLGNHFIVDVIRQVQREVGIG